MRDDPTAQTLLRLEQLQAINGGVRETGYRPVLWRSALMSVHLLGKALAEDDWETPTAGKGGGLLHPSHGRTFRIKRVGKRP